MRVAREVVLTIVARLRRYGEAHFENRYQSAILCPQAASAVGIRYGDGNVGIERCDKHFDSRIATSIKRERSSQDMAKRKSTSPPHSVASNNADVAGSLLLSE